MRTNEYFRGGTGWKEYPLRGVGSIPAEEHPLSEDPHVTLKEGTRYIQLFTYLGDDEQMPVPPVAGSTFWEQQFPAGKPQGPVITLEEYNELLASQGMPLEPGAWVSVPEASTLYSPTLHIATHVEEPVDSRNQLRATTVFQRAAPDGVPSHRGTAFADALEANGFPPDAFYHFRTHARSIEVPRRILRVAARGLRIMGQDGVATAATVAGAASDAALGLALPRGVARERIRTSKH